MPIDPSIALSYNPAPLGPNVGQTVQTANALLALQQQQKQVQTANTLKQILGQPGAIDPTGNPTPEALGRVTALDPALGINLRQNMLKQQEQTLRMDVLKGDAFGKQLDAMHDAYTPILEQYREDAPNDPIGAQKSADAAVAAKTKELSGAGWLPPEVVRGLPQKFDFTRFSQSYQTVQDLQARRKALLDQDKQRRDDARLEKAGWTIQTDPTQKDAAGNPKQFRYNAGTGEATELDGKTPYAPGGAVKPGAPGREYGSPVEVEYQGQDGKKVSVLAQQEKGTGAWVTADENRTPIRAAVTPVKPLIPGSPQADRAAIAEDIDADPLWKDKPAGVRAAEVERQMSVIQGKVSDPASQHSMAQAIAGYQESPLTGYAMARPGSPAPQIMAEVLKINPDYQAARYPEVNRAMTEFGSGKLGSIVRSMNVGIQHLDSIDELGKALKNGDVRVVNSIAQGIKQEFGVPAPVTFDAAKQIVADEIVKAIVGYSGAVNDRESMQAKLNKANSPEQLLAVTKEFRALMAGQLRGLKKQYEDSTGFKDGGAFGFDTKLLPATKRELGMVEKAEGARGGGTNGLVPAATDQGGNFYTGDKPPPDHPDAKLAPAGTRGAGKWWYKGPDGTFVAATAVPQPAAAPAQPAAPTAAAPDPLATARDAIARGAPRDKVIERLRAHGVDPAGL